MIEKLNADMPVSTDESTKLEADIDSTTQTSSHQEIVTIDFNRVHPHTAAIMLFVDGGSRNFGLTQRLIVHCSEENKANGKENMMAKVAQGAFMNRQLFKCINRPRKDSEGLALCVLYKDGWGKVGCSAWAFRLFFEGIYTDVTKAKMNMCDELVVSYVPNFLKYRPRLFPSVKAICAVLSSRALPKLKAFFLKNSRNDGGIKIRGFTTMIFNYLYGIDSRILEVSEAAYTVAVIQVILFLTQRVCAADAMTIANDIAFNSSTGNVLPDEFQ